MDSGLASASLRRPGMTRLTKVDTLSPRVLTQVGLEMLDESPKIVRPLKIASPKPQRSCRKDRCGRPPRSLYHAASNESCGRP